MNTNKKIESDFLKNVLPFFNMFIYFFSVCACSLSTYKHFCYEIDICRNINKIRSLTIHILKFEQSVALDESYWKPENIANISRFKQPKRLVIVDELPRNTMGKVQKNLLRDQYSELLS